MSSPQPPSAPWSGPAPSRSASPPPRRSRRDLVLALGIAGAILLLLGVGGGAVIAYLSGIFADHGRFTGSVHPCSLITPNQVEPLVPGQTHREERDWGIFEACTVKPDTTPTRAATPAAETEVNIEVHRYTNVGRIGAAEYARRGVKHRCGEDKERASGLGDVAVHCMHGAGARVVFAVDNLIVIVEHLKRTPTATVDLGKTTELARAIKSRLG